MSLAALYLTGQPASSLYLPLGFYLFALVSLSGQSVNSRPLFKASNLTANIQLHISYVCMHVCVFVNGLWILSKGTSECHKGNVYIHLMTFEALICLFSFNSSVCVSMNSSVCLCCSIVKIPSIISQSPNDKV